MDSNDDLAELMSRISLEVDASKKTSGAKNSLEALRAYAASSTNNQTARSSGRVRESVFRDYKTRAFTTFLSDLFDSIGLPANYKKMYLLPSSVAMFGTAFVHRTAAHALGGHSYEVYEIVGDTLLSNAAMTWIIHNKPTLFTTNKAFVGDINEWKKTLVSRKAASTFARLLKLHEWVSMAPTAAKARANDASDASLDMDAVLEDVFEAFIGVMGLVPYMLKATPIIDPSPAYLMLRMCTSKVNVEDFAAPSYEAVVREKFGRDIAVKVTRAYDADNIITFTATATVRGDEVFTAEAASSAEAMRRVFEAVAGAHKIPLIAPRSRAAEDFVDNFRRQRDDASRPTAKSAPRKK